MNRADTEYRKDIIHRTEVLRMAREAGFYKDQPMYYDESMLERFAELVASAAQAKEREQCAKLVDYWESRQGEHSDAIRARGQA